MDDMFYPLHNSFEGHAVEQACKFHQDGRRRKLVGHAFAERCTVFRGCRSMLVLLWPVAVKEFESEDHSSRFQRGGQWLVWLVIDPPPVLASELEGAPRRQTTVDLEHSESHGRGASPPIQCEFHWLGRQRMMQWTKTTSPPSSGSDDASRSDPKSNPGRNRTYGGTEYRLPRRSAGAGAPRLRTKLG